MHALIKKGGEMESTSFTHGNFNQINSEDFINKLEKAAKSSGLTHVALNSENELVLTNKKRERLSLHQITELSRTIFDEKILNPTANYRNWKEERNFKEKKLENMDKIERSFAAIVQDYEGPTQNASSRSNQSEEVKEARDFLAHCQRERMEIMEETGNPYLDERLPGVKEGKFIQRTAERQIGMSTDLYVLEDELKNKIQEGASKSEILDRLDDIIQLTVKLGKLGGEIDDSAHKLLFPD